VTGSARAGVTAFGGELSIASSRIDCSAISIDIEPKTVGGASYPPNVLDGGDNVCGCDTVHGACHAQTSGLEPIGVEPR